MHPVDAAELGLGGRVGDAEEVLGRLRVRARTRTACAVLLPLQLVDHGHDVAGRGVARVDDGEVERVRRGPAKGELQREVHGVGVGGGRAGERPGDGGVPAVARVQVAPDDVVGPPAAGLVRGPRGCLAGAGAVGRAAASRAALQGWGGSGSGSDGASLVVDGSRGWLGQVGFPHWRMGALIF